MSVKDFAFRYLLKQMVAYKIISTRQGSNLNIEVQSSLTITEAINLLNLASRKGINLVITGSLKT